MQRARRLKIATVVFTTITLLALVAVLIIVLRNSFTSGLITLTLVLGVVGVVSAAGAVLSFGFGRDTSGGITPVTAADKSE